jgi:outer membrane lipopolysaccharide assembly protein LptE/RlpB
VGSNQILADTYVRQDLVSDMQRDVIYQLLNQLRLQFNTSHTNIS